MRRKIQSESSQSELPSSKYRWKIMCCLENLILIPEALSLHDLDHTLPDCEALLGHIYVGVKVTHQPHCTIARLAPRSRFLSLQWQKSAIAIFVSSALKSTQAPQVSIQTCQQVLKHNTSL